MLSDTHSVFVSFTLDFSFFVMNTVKKKRDLYITNIIFYFATVYVEVE